MDGKMEVMDRKITSMDKRITALDEKVTSLDEKLTALDERVTSLEAGQQKLKKDLLTEMYTGFDKMHTDMISRTDKLAEDINDYKKQTIKIEFLNDKVNQLEEEIFQLKKKIK
jgi:chromosome segregation ATPase